MRANNKVIIFCTRGCIAARVVWATKNAMSEIKAKTDFDQLKVDAILKETGQGRGVIIPALQGIQKEFGYLPQPALQYLSWKIKVPMSTIYGVATFYGQFHLQPRGKNVIRTCLGTACHVRGGAKILEKLQEVLGLEVGGTTEDMKFTLESVACIGACGLAPVMMINDNTFGRLTPEKIPEIIENYEKDLE